MGEIRQSDPGSSETPAESLLTTLLIAGLLLVSILCVGPLPSLVVPKALDRTMGARVTKVKADIAAIYEGLNGYVLDHGGQYPASLEALLVPGPSGAVYLDVRVLPRDPWGNEYGYEPPPRGERPRVFSLGSDGRPGGKGEAQDIDHLVIRNGKI